MQEWEQPLQSLGDFNGMELEGFMVLVKLMERAHHC